MNTLRSLWLALESLAVSLAEFAATVNAVNSEIRQRAGIGTSPGTPLIENGKPNPDAFPPPGHHAKRAMKRMQE
jgi:hypothetical protein